MKNLSHLGIIPPPTEHNDIIIIPPPKGTDIKVIQPYSSPDIKIIPAPVQEPATPPPPIVPDPTTMMELHNTISNYADFRSGQENRRTRRALERMKKKKRYIHMK